ncbi:GLPGLI family protein [Flavobacterium sp. 17A]|uniref:GLPGLI family protein n=1 Tax=Flavobacterium potami TaxID=2872310 RepID=A0A9X1KRJ4_9FLAO|nr:GLPGLI family protein [Flavobacterium potami]MBZ4036112.1 GLPGLI family protein [Flavobacterium potami]
MLKIFKKGFCFVLLNLICVNSVSSQITRVTYKSSVYDRDVNLTKSTEEKKKGQSDKQIGLLKEFMKNQEDTEFELLYNKRESLYQKVEKLSIGEDSKLSKILDNNKYYKNLEKQIKFYQRDKPELYNVIVPFDEYKWEITNEMKMVDGYKCYKATTTYEDIYNPHNDRKLVFTPIVWFTPDIPASFGPKGLDGLPGLVLEASINGKKYLYVSKIEFEYNKVKEIERPKRGKDITKEELEAKILENYKKN